jgi:nicotinamide mononucleotide transporter
MIEILAVIFGVVQSVLIMLNKRSNWIFYVLQMVFLAIFSYTIRLYGNVILDILYIILGVVGYINWNKENGKDSEISVLDRKDFGQHCVISLFLLALVGIYVTMMPGEFKAFDILTVWTSILATIAMVRHKVESWIIWLVNDILYIVTYFMLEDKPVYLIVMYAFWTVMAIVSFVSWRKKYKESKNTEDVRKGV